MLPFLIWRSVSEPERRDFWEICEDRYQVRSTILTSQLPVSRWHEQVGDPTLADDILVGFSKHYNAFGGTAKKH
jgi:hypothetical protein